jgi:microsomal dipeptidase-like Zn-dependent dipeptidase
MYQNAFVIDGLEYCKADRSYFESLQKGGITAVHVTIVYHENARETLTRFAEWNRFFEDHNDIIIPVMSVNDIEVAKKTNKVGIFFGAQNCSPIDDEIGLVEVMRKQGLLIMQLTYNNQSLLASGCYEKNDSGVTNFGKQVISEMNRVGMIIDMSHSAEKSTLETIEISKKPICISHANPSFAVQALRNKSNDVLKSLINSNGFFGFSLYPFHLPNNINCSLDEFCQMIYKTADLLGNVENLGIGSDLCLGQPLSILEWMRNGKWSKKMNYGEGSKDNACWPDPLKWFASPADMINVYKGLIKCGFSESDADNIIGNNWFRFLQKNL